MLNLERESYVHMPVRFVFSVILADTLGFMNINNLINVISPTGSPRGNDALLRHTNDFSMAMHQRELSKS